MNRRDALKSLAMLPVAGIGNPADQYIFPSIVGVKETPWLRCKVMVFCDGEEVKRCVRASIPGGWCEFISGQGWLVLRQGTIEIVPKEGK
jgi:hypothetical protein